MSDRAAQITAFLAEAGWADAAQTPIPGDAGSRRYMRLRQGGSHALLMDCPPDPEGVLAPIDATPTARKSMGYAATARLSGSAPDAFVTLAAALRQRGFSAPDILAADLSSGLVILEDFGDGLYAPMIASDPELEKPLYGAAVDTLAEIYRASFPKALQGHGTEWTVQAYDATAMLAEVDLFLDWYLPDIGTEVTEDLRAEYHSLWQAALQHLNAHAPGLCLRDFHAENLFWLPERESVSRVGLIDFQDALFVHPAYDLASFLEDARRDVSIDLHAPLKAQFCVAAGLRHDADFDTAYSVIAAQRNVKILGIFVRLDRRDGKPHYRDFMPRVAAHLKRDLDHPACADLRGWFAQHAPQVLS